MKKTFGSSIVLLTAFLALSASAATFTTLYSFTGANDGAYPGGLSLVGNALYGPTSGGGANSDGTIYSVLVNGTAFTTQYTFTGSSTNGAFPGGGLILSGTNLYGMVSGNGSSYGGLYFVSTNGLAFTTLPSAVGGVNGFGAGVFNGGVIAISGSTLYGKSRGGINPAVVFTETITGTNGTNLALIYTVPSSNPRAPSVLSGGNLYGTATGGANGFGTVYTITTGGTGLTTLYSFTGGNDGANPAEGLILSGSTLYGTTMSGGSTGFGTVFSLTTGGSFTTLYTFTGTSGAAYPFSLSGLGSGILYGATGGGSTGGIIFSVHTDGTVFSTLHSFSGIGNGLYESSPMVLSGTTLYGTVGGFGTNYGSIFSLTTP